MRLSCPQCHTEYDVPDAALAGPAKTLRCSDCGAKFKAPALRAAPEPPEEIALEAVPETELFLAPEEIDHAMIETALPDVVAAAPEAAMPDPLPSLARPANKRRTIAQKPDRALSISILLVVLAVALVLAEHRAIAHAWPPSLRLFDALGLR